MTKRILTPPHLREAAEALNMSPGVVSGGHVFLTGATGSDPQGRMPDDPATQFHAVFDKVEQVLRAGGMDLDDMVEMTTYHIGLRGHFDLFDEVRLARLSAPYPAWTAVEAAGLRRVGALVEMRVIAAQRMDDAARPAGASGR